MGKTRLAVEVGFRTASAWPDGVWFVDLSTAADEERVIAAVADTLGVSPTRRFAGIAAQRRSRTTTVGSS